MSTGTEARKKVKEFEAADRVGIAATLVLVGLISIAALAFRGSSSVRQAFLDDRIEVSGENCWLDGAISRCIGKVVLPSAFGAHSHFRAVRTRCGEGNQKPCVKFWATNAEHPGAPLQKLWVYTGDKTPILRNVQVWQNGQPRIQLVFVEDES